MHAPREEHRVGLAALRVGTTLLQRGRSAHPTDGLFEAADLQWWWRNSRTTDEIAQLFFFDGDEPVAAAILTDWGDAVAFEAITMPGSEPAWIRHVHERGLAHAAGLGIENLDVEVDVDDAVRLGVLAAHGFARKENGLVETWMHADDRPAVTSLAAGYRLECRADDLARSHHLALRGEPETTQRLEQTSLYRQDLDLLVIAPDDQTASYGLFWYDLVTATALVEPMRTAEDHQRRGLARHVLTAGVDLLARAGAERIKICYEVDNPPARDLYLDVGFQPVRRTDIYAKRVAT